MGFHDLLTDRNPFSESADICIIGAGAAGLTLADELCQSGAKVIVVESGPPVFDRSTPPPDDVIISGHAFVGAREGRVRAFGGTTNRWGGKCHPLSEIDFTPRSWVPHSGWPIRKSDLDPYYRRAEAFLGMTGFDFSAAVWGKLGITHPAIDSNVLGLGFSKFNSEVLGGNGEGIQDIGALIRPHLEKSSNVAVYCNGTVTELVPSDNGGHIRSVRIRTPNGDAFSATASHYVICGGGIETPRLLLCSRRRAPSGIGNGRNLVGRFFADHPIIDAARIETDNPLWLQERYNLNQDGNQIFWANFTLPASVQEKEGVLNCNANIFFDWHPESGIQAAMDLYRDVLARHIPANLRRNLWRVGKRFPEVVYYGSRFFLTKKWPTPRPQRIRFRCHVEQLPDPDSRITLSDQVDGFGMPIPRLDWRLHEFERRTAAVMVNRANEAFQTAGIGRVIAESCIRDPSADWQSGIEEGFHHLGTTRMSDSAETGVVNSECRVHGVDNLFICSSSVFPTGGSENPTFTIIALAMRLADHLKAT